MTNISAAEWLLKELEPGTRPVRELRDAAARAGILWREVEREKIRLGVVTTKPNFLEGWEWAIPRRHREETADRSETAIPEPEGARRHREETMVSRQDTIEALRARIRELEADLAASEAGRRRARKSAQPELPGVPLPPPPPPRELTVDQEVLNAFHDARRKAIADLPGVEFAPDDTPYGRQIKAVQQLRAACGPESEAQLDVVGRLFAEFFDDPWAAGLTPPFPMSALQSQKIYPRYLAKIRGDAKAAAH